MTSSQRVAFHYLLAAKSKETDYEFEGFDLPAVAPRNGKAFWKNVPGVMWRDTDSVKIMGDLEITINRRDLQNLAEDMVSLGADEVRVGLSKVVGYAPTDAKEVSIHDQVEAFFYKDGKEIKTGDWPPALLFDGTFTRRR